MFVVVSWWYNDMIRESMLIIVDPDVRPFEGTTWQQECWDHRDISRSRLVTWMDLMHDSALTSKMMQFRERNKFFRKNQMTSGIQTLVFQIQDLLAFDPPMVAACQGHLSEAQVREWRRRRVKWKMPWWYDMILCLNIVFAIMRDLDFKTFLQVCS